MSNNSNVAELRYSAINTMHNCKLSAWLIYKEHLKGYQNLFARFGTVLHDILEEYGNHCVQNKLDTDYSKFDEIKFRHLPDLDESQIKDACDVLETIKGNINWNSILQYPIIEIEKRFSVNSELIASEIDKFFSSGVDVCYIDGDTAYVMDWKTVRAIYTKKYMEESLQRKIYSWQILKYYPEVQTVQFAFNFVRYGYQSPWMPILREELNELESQIKGEIQSLQELLALEEPPEASPSAYCQLCPNSGHCKEYENAFIEMERIESSEDALKLYQHFQLAKIRTKRMEEMLKFYVDHNEPIKLEHEIWGPQTHPKVEYPDTKKLINILFKECEIPEGAIYDQLKLTKTSIEKLTKKFKLNAEQKALISKLSIETQTTKYETKKIEEEVNESEGDGYLDPYI